MLSCMALNSYAKISALLWFVHVFPALFGQQHQNKAYSSGKRAQIHFFPEQHALLFEFYPAVSYLELNFLQFFSFFSDLIF